jgi:hypothetical protein
MQKHAKATEFKKLTYAEWRAIGTRLYGEDSSKWKFTCPVCKHVQSAEDYFAAGFKKESEGMIGFSCIGRLLPGSRPAFSNKHNSKSGPCDYAGGGLFALNPLHITDKNVRVFDFADPWGEGQK